MIKKVEEKQGRNKGGRLKSKTELKQEKRRSAVFVKEGRK